MQTPVITTSYFVNTNPVVFPEPYAFDPERWIKAAEDGKYLGKYIANFTRAQGHALESSKCYVYPKIDG